MEDYEICKQVLKSRGLEILVNWETFPGISWEVEKPEGLGLHKILPMVIYKCKMHGGHSCYSGEHYRTKSPTLKGSRLLPCYYTISSRSSVFAFLNW
jgi:hypothetical protein